MVLQQHRDRWFARLVLSLVAALGLASCLDIEQDPCTADETICVDGAVWSCRADGTGWGLQAICPGATCEDGRCVVDPLPSFDVTLAFEDVSSAAPEDVGGPEDLLSDASD